MTKLFKWQEAYFDVLSRMTNEEMLDEYTYLSGGDDYDGCYTNRGRWKYKKIDEELKKRLTAYGFFGKRIVITEKRYN